MKLREKNAKLMESMLAEHASPSQGEPKREAGPIHASPSQGEPASRFGQERQRTPELASYSNSRDTSPVPSLQLDGPDGRRGGGSNDPRMQQRVSALEEQLYEKVSTPTEIT